MHELKTFEAEIKAREHKAAAAATAAAGEDAGDDNSVGERRQHTAFVVQTVDGQTHTLFDSGPGWDRGGEVDAESLWD